MHPSHLSYYCKSAMQKHIFLIVAMKCSFVLAVGTRDSCFTQALMLSHMYGGRPQGWQQLHTQQGCKPSTRSGATLASAIIASYVMEKSSYMQQQKYDFCSQQHSISNKFVLHLKPNVKETTLLKCATQGQVN